MKKHLICLVVLLLIQLASSGQVQLEDQEPDLDSIHQVLSNLPGTEKIDTLNSIAFRIYKDYPDIVSDKVTNPYHSDNEEPLRREQLIEFLKENKLLEESIDKEGHPAERYWGI